MTKKRAKLSGPYQAWVVVQIGSRSAWPLMWTASGRKKESIKTLEETWGEPWRAAALRHNLECIKVTVS